MEKTHELTHGNLRKVFLNYLIPSVGGMLGTSLYVLGDTMIVGRGLGSQGLAALNLSIPIINVFNGLGLLFGIGGATALSVDKGMGKTDGLDKIFTKSVLFSLICGIILTLVRVFFLDEFVSFLGAEGEIFNMSKDYLGVMLSFSIAFLLNPTIMVFVRNDGAPKLAMTAMLTGSIINVILDYVFIMRMDMGMWGGALATGLSPVIGLSILSTHFIKKKNGIKLSKLKDGFRGARRIFANGIPSFVVECSAGIVIFAFNQSLLNIAGNIGVSAYSIIANLSLIAAAIFTGVGQAIQPIVSVNYGAKNLDRILHTFRLGFFTSIGLGIFFYALGLFFPEMLIGIFVRDISEVLDITKTGIRIYFLSFLLMGVNIVMTSYVQSKEQARTSLIISLLRGLIFIIVLLMILPKFLGINGVWWTLPLTELLTFFVSIIFFSKCTKAIKCALRR